MKYPKDLENMVFNRFTVLKKVGLNKRRVPLYECKCICGNIKIVSRDKLVSNHTKSCGCLNPRVMHGLTETKIYSTFWGIKSRCNNKKNKGFKYYGGRGIKCEWKNFIEFKDDMYIDYLKHIEEFGAKQTSIDRINNDGNYCKENCRWATSKEQNNNRSIKRKLICCPNCKFYF